MKPFRAFADTGDVKRVSADLALARSLFGDAESRFQAFFPPEKLTKFVFENGYEAIRELVDGLLAANGYKSYSHEAPIAFLSEQHVLSEKEAGELDHMRYLRNQSKYYGKQFEEGELLALSNKIMCLYPKIKAALQKAIR